MKEYVIPTLLDDVVHVAVWTELWSLAVDNFAVQQELWFDISERIFFSVDCPRRHPKRVNIAFLPIFFPTDNLKRKEKLKGMDEKKCKILRVQWTRESRLVSLQRLSEQKSLMFRNRTILLLLHPIPCKRMKEQVVRLQITVDDVVWMKELCGQGLLFSLRVKKGTPAFLLRNHNRWALWVHLSIFPSWTTSQRNQIGNAPKLVRSMNNIFL